MEEIQEQEPPRHKPTGLIVPAITVTADDGDDDDNNNNMIIIKNNNNNMIIIKNNNNNRGKRRSHILVAKATLTSVHATMPGRPLWNSLESMGCSGGHALLQKRRAVEDAAGG